MTKRRVDKDLLDQTRAVLATLTPQEEKVLRMRYGLGGEFVDAELKEDLSAVELELGAVEWAAHIVESMAFRHITVSPVCIGYCMWGGGRASCHECGWRCSARLDDPPQAGHGYFAMMALGTIGLAVQSAICAGAWDLIASIDDLETVAAAIQIAIDGPEDA